MSKPKPAKSGKPAAVAPAAAEPAWQKKLDALGASPLAYVAASILLLVPCFWHARIEAGDLSSHVYNAWLAQLVARGQAPGLSVASQTTNILFDLMLSAFWSLFGMAWAQRIAVSLAVLVFAWGAFAFAGVVAGRRAWNVFPAIAILAYGWVFHIGFFNFYLSLGLCLWAMALTWEQWTPGRTGAAVALLAVAWLAHALPVAWAVALMSYRWLLARVPAERRLRLAMAALAAMFLARLVMGSLIQTRGSPTQISLITGIDQMWIFDDKYLWLSLALLLLWALRLIDLLRAGPRELLAQAPFHFCLLSAAGIVIFPTWVAIPGYKHALAYIAERLSLPLAVCVCALLAAARPRMWQLGALAAVALLFFGFTYRDEGVLNAFEDRLEHLVAQLPPNQRVVEAVNDSALRANPVTHMIDRICVGRCYSYANYEPSTAQFRVRVNGPSPIIASTYGDSLGLQTGTYVVKPGDLPLYVVGLNEQGNLAIRSAAAGSQIGSTEIDLL